MRRIGWLLIVLIGFTCGAAADEPVHVRIERAVTRYDVGRDLTWVQTIERDELVLTARGAAQRDRAATTFHPGTQSAELVEAWVTQPDGTRLDVTPANVFTRPSQASQGAPGFTSTQTITALFPQVRAGSRMHARWRITQREPAMLGFNVWTEPPMEAPVDVATVEIRAPADLPLHWRARGGFEVTDTAADGMRHIEARIADTHAVQPERNQVASRDFRPLFLATSLGSLEELGALYHKRSAVMAAPTPEIEALARRIAGDRTGLDAAAAVYRWITTNLRYVAVYLDPNSGWVPRPAAQVLKDGFGDCKDHVVLMQAMLSTLGIRAEAGLIEWGTSYEPLPLWTPWQFNHVVLYLPDYDRFANPTNPYAPFEAMDRRLSGRPVVMASEEGRVMRTPPSRPEDNRTEVDAEVQVAPDGTISGRSRITESPVLSSGPRSAVAGALSTRELAERMLLQTPEGGFGDLEATDPRDLSKPFEVTATWRSPRGAPAPGRDLQIAVPVGIDFEPASRLRQALLPDRPRAYPVLAGARDQAWNTVLHLPADWTVRELPAPVRVETPAGRYVATYERTGDGVRVSRRLVLLKDVYQPGEVGALEQVLYAPLDDARAILTLTPGEAEFATSPTPLPAAAALRPAPG